MSPLFKREREPAPPPKPPEAAEWARAELLVPVEAPRQPSLVSDGSGLPFAPQLLHDPQPPLDPADPAVGALLAEIHASRARLGREGDADATVLLAPWRQLARTEDEVLFGAGVPPEHVTAALRRRSRGRWTTVAISRGRPLRATRDGIRASSFRLDPTVEPAPGDRELRVLVTEQTHATGKLAHGRLLAPDLYASRDEVVLRMFVRPLGGFQNRAVRNHETPVRIALPEPLGTRAVRDGARYPSAAV